MNAGALVAQPFRLRVKLRRTTVALAKVVRAARAHGRPEGLRYLIALAFAVTGAVALAAQAPTASCEALSGLKVQDATITTAADVAAGPFKPNASANGPTMTVPSFCRVAATLTPTPESHIKIEVWLPPTGAWNGKFLGTGNGGAGWVISYPALANGLSKGYATTNTDMGTTTTGLDFTFGVGHRERR